MIGENFAPASQRNAGNNRAWMTIGDTRYHAGFADMGEFRIYSVVTESDFYSNLNVMRAVSVGASILAILVMGIVLFAVLSHVIRPIYRLQAASKEIAAGNLNINLPAGGSDEVGRLTRDFTVLAGIMRSLVDDMEKFNHEANVVGGIEYRIDPQSIKAATAR